MLNTLLESFGVDITGFETLVDFLREKGLTEPEIKELIEETVARLNDMGYKLPTEDGTHLVVAAWMADTLVNGYAGWSVSSVDGPYYNDQLPTVYLEDEYYYLFDENNQWNRAALDLLGNPERVLELLPIEDWITMSSLRIPVFLCKDDDETMVIPKWDELDYSAQIVVENLITPPVKRILENLEESLEFEEPNEEEVLEALKKAAVGVV